MKVFRKSVIVLLILCLSSVLAAGSAMATPPWMDKGKVKGWEKAKQQPQVKVQLQGKIRFNDVSGHWAEQNIVLINSEDVIKGYNDGSFKPNKPVNKEEALTMIARMTYGNVTATPVKLKNTRISSWAGPSLELAVKKGIISRVELDTLAFNKPAQRYEVAVWLVRALGMEDEALDNAGAELDFKDAAAIPAWARGYVKVATEEEIISGFPNHVFKPGAPVTRAEMATMLVRAREGSEMPSPRQGFSFVQGVITEIDDDSVTVKCTGGFRNVGTKELTVTVDDETIIYVNGQRADLEDLDEDDAVTLLLDGDKQAVVILARAGGDKDEDDSDIEDGAVEGLVESIGSRSITVKVDGALQVYTLDSDVEVEVDGDEADLDDIKKGYEVELTLEDSKVIRIEYDTETKYVSGIMESMGDDNITVKVSGVLKVYTLDEDVDVELDGRNVDPEDVKKGYDVKLTLENNKVTKIAAESEIEDVSGIVESVGTDSITVKVNGALNVYNLSDDVDVELDGNNADPEDLEKGYKVEMTVENGKVTEIVAYTGTINGILESVTTSSITIKTGSSYKVYDLSDDVDVVVNDEDADLDDLDKGADVWLTLDDDEVIKIVAE